MPDHHQNATLDQTTHREGEPIQIELQAAELARNHAVTRRRAKRPALLTRERPVLLKRLDQQEELLRTAYQRFRTSPPDEVEFPYAAEWVLDNFYLIEQSVRLIREDMPVGYYRQLPTLDSPLLRGYPRAFALAWHLIERASGQVDLDEVRRFTLAYQDVTPLTTGELWALPLMLRQAVLESLSQALARLANIQIRPDDELPSVAREPGDGAEATVANCITSLRALSTQDWMVFFEAVSQVDAVLRRDPADVYARMDFDTRNRYRGVIEELSRATERDEEDVAHLVVALAHAHVDPAERHLGKASSRQAHIGYYLIDAGRDRLEAALGYRPGAMARPRRWAMQHPTFVYLGGISLLTLLVVLAVLSSVSSSSAGPLSLVGAALLVLLPATAISVPVVNWLVSLAIPPRILPKFDFKSGLPPECRTMVVMPTLITSTADIDHLVQQLELQHLRNTDPHLSFALLTDFADAPGQHQPEDAALIEHAQAAIKALNRKHARYDSHPRGPFYFFHRERRWNPAEDCWMAWERKRGKLMEFNRLLRGAGDTSYCAQVGDLGILPHIRYVITLDADTILTHDSAHRLVGALAHPLNQAVFARDGDTVLSGYTVLQPRTEVGPTSAQRSRFTRVFAGDSGLDLYTHASSDVYQDLFGEGIYVGKGIYDVDAFERSLRNAAPQNALLSHDLFEGIHGRAALVTDVVLVEDYPPNYLTYALRMRRWIRGDWQLLPWLLPSVQRADGTSAANRLSPISRWKIVDNLRRSLLAPSLMAFFTGAWLGLFSAPGQAQAWPPFGWTLFGALTLAVPAITNAVNAAIGLVGDLTRRPRKSMVGRSLWSVWPDAARWLLALVFLPYEASMTLEAVSITLVRLVVTRRRMLQWTTAAHTARRVGRTPQTALVWRQMAAAPAIALTLAASIVLLNPVGLVAAAPLLLAWLVSPHIALWISQRRSARVSSISDGERRKLRGLACRTWMYFERFAGPADNWLPPDHYQEQPLGTVAHVTSPTNIGMSLLSTLSAYDLGYTTALDCTLRLHSTLESMGKLKRHRGHFMNWYDTRTLEPLQPVYVSTVDSGNLAACLLALKQGCLALPSTHVMRWEQFQGLLDILTVVGETADSLTEPGGSKPLTSLVAQLADLERQVAAAQHHPDRWRKLLSQLIDERLQRLDELVVALIGSQGATLDARSLGDLQFWVDRVHLHLDNLQAEWDFLLPGLAAALNPPVLFTRGRPYGDSQSPTHLPAAGADLEPAEDANTPLDKAWRALEQTLVKPCAIGEIERAHEHSLAQLSRVQALLDAEAASPQEAAEAHTWCADLAAALTTARAAAVDMARDCRNLADQAEAYFTEMDFRFLLNEQREVFHIGYHLASDKLDDHFYDLLASEARIASLVAIAKGDAPASHWLHLARPLTQVGGQQTLLSWSGTMFEYLMPLLLMRQYSGMFLDQCSRAAVEIQIAYGHRQRVPWGISESGYYGFDAAQNYQYRAFGVPGLGFKRGLAEDLVVAPYATLLALPVLPQEAARNIESLTQLGALGRYGLFEALDYTPSRLPLGQKHVVVRSYMAHHQGMSLLALANILQHNSMVNRFHADPRIRSVELLLQERIPQRAPLEQPHDRDGDAIHSSPPIAVAPWEVPLDTPMPAAHLLSNGRYSVIITNAGSGYSQWRDVALTRWSADATLDAQGAWIYLQDRDSGQAWSASHQPTLIPASSHTVTYHAHMAEFRRVDDGISAHMEVVAVPDDDVELRRITLTNHSGRARKLRLTSYGEVVLTRQADDRRHAAFNKLFIESEYAPSMNALVFRRRPRSADEQTICLAHALIVEPGRNVTGAYESDRARFLGRGQSLSAPAALQARGTWLSKTIGATLDPIMALGQDIDLEPDERAQVVYLTLAAGSRQDALALAQRYQAWPALERAFSQAASANEQELRRLHLGTPDLERFDQLLSCLLYPHRALRAAPSTLAANSTGQSGLYAFGLSGDLPIVLARADDQSALLADLLRAHRYWRERGIKTNLVILNEQDTGYNQELAQYVQRQVANTDSGPWLNQREGIFVLRANQLTDRDRALLYTVARVVLDDRDGSLAEQLERLRQRSSSLPLFTPTASPSRADAAFAPPVQRPSDLRFDNSLGGFSADGREYVIYLEPGQATPAPWINVIANPHFGFIVSEAGAGCTWSLNSGENRLTPWNNDPVADTPGEAIYLRDEETGEVWSPTPAPAGAPSPYLIRHGAGYTTFEHHSHGLKQHVRLYAVPDAPVKVSRLRLENATDRPRWVTATYYAEWVLGTTPNATRQHIVSDFSAAQHTLLAHNAYNAEFGRRVAFVTADREFHSLTADREEFLGRMGDLRFPDALRRIGLSGNLTPGMDPCAVIQVHVNLAPGETQDVLFFMGEGADREDALRLAQGYKDPSHAQEAWKAVGEMWANVLGAITVETPDAAMNLMLNRWLLHQVVSCRLWGRTALYQSSGAFGFRDQLQDVMALMNTAAPIAREYILNAAQRQFELGDVLHWWHPPSGRGVRTRCSDDLVWLPFVTAHYVSVTGDDSILAEQVPFLIGQPLKTEEEDRYGYYGPTEETGSLYEHCCRALARAFRLGAHGLPLIGTGDWNDGMNRVGMAGRGESVWLGWFLYATLKSFAPLCDRANDQAQAAAYRQQAEALRQALEASAWDGQWYCRAFYDDGAPLGSAENLECKIDSIAQSWSVLSGAAGRDRAARAMQSVADRLVLPQDRLVLLFAPPFDQTARDPGYVKGYVPGIRENGGQYTHAATWVAWAFAALGEGERAAALFQLLNPINHGDSLDKALRYKVEPYAIAADIYGAPPHVGRGGWTWYTGSASWMYRLGIEAILGLRRSGQTLRIDPCIPSAWPGFTMTAELGGATYHIEVRNPDGVARGVCEVSLDGAIVPDGVIRLSADNRRHEVVVRMGLPGDRPVGAA